MSDNAQIDWEDLRHFLALAEGGSLSEAARRLNVDHTTVARRLASLEKTLDLRLVDRLPRAVLLTPEGRRIAEAGKGIEDTVFAVARAAAGAGSSLAGPVRISAPPAFATAVLAPRIAAWRTRFPAIAITLLGEVGAADLGHRQADISLRLSRPDKESPDLVARKVGELSFAFYAAQGYDVPEPDWAFIAYDDGSSRIPQHGWLEARLEGRTVVLRTNDAASQAAATRSGLGVALLPRFLGDGDPGLKEMPSAEPFPVREVWMLVHDDLRHAPRIRAVMDFLQQTVAEA